MMNQRTRDIFLANTTWPYVSMRNLYDNTNPQFAIAPTNIARIKTFLLKKWTDNSDINWAYDTATTVNGTWPLGENLRYSNTTLRGAGMGGFPLGDLYHWFSSNYTSWAAQEAAENAQITTWLVNGTPDGVEEQPEIPAEFELGQNYPNPFNPTTTIEYSVSKAGSLSLKVYNVLGKEVAALYSGTRQPGNYSATFDGHGLASGVYFYRLESRTSSITKKLVLMK